MVRGKAPGKYKVSYLTLLSKTTDYLVWRLVTWSYHAIILSRHARGTFCLT